MRPFFLFKFTKMLMFIVFRFDSGELSILWGEALNKTIPPISKILKDEKNQDYFKDEVELKVYFP